MTRKTLTTSLIVLISAVIFIISYQSVKSCGPSFEPDYYYSIFDKSIFNLPELKPFFLSDYIFADQDESGTSFSTFDNLKDWKNYFQNIPSIDHIETIVYSTGLDTLKRIKEYLTSGNKKLLTNDLKTNTLVNYLKEKKDSEFINYLIFAKECEPEVAVHDQWEEIKRDSAHMLQLIERGNKNYTNSQSGFIRDRYAYQVIRLAHYSKQYDKTVNLFDNYFGSNNKPGIMYFWSLAHKAGALKSLNKTSESNILFAHIFDSCQSRRKQSVLSVNLSSDSLLYATFLLCKDSREKIIINTLAAYKNSAYSLDAIKNIYALEPSSVYLELLLSREVTRYEREILPTRQAWGEYRSFLANQEPESKLNALNLFKIISQIANENKTGKPWLWNFAAGYLATLLDKTDAAKEFYLNAKKSAPTDNLMLIRKIQVAEIVNDVNEIRFIDKNTEEELAQKLTWLKRLDQTDKINSVDAMVYIMNTLAKKYMAQKDTLKTHLCLGVRINGQESYHYYPSETYNNTFCYDLRIDYSNEPIDTLLNLLGEREQQYSNSQVKQVKVFSSFEKFLLENYMYSYRDLANIKAKELICKGNFSGALEQFEKAYISNNYGETSEKLWADPFVIHYKDCHDCDYQAVNFNRYTLVSFCKKMIELKKLAESDTKKSAEYYFQLGNGYYNKSYYGNSWIASAFSRSSYQWGYFPGYNRYLYDCSEAKKCYLEAVNKADNKEFAAKCLYMAAKCELNAYYSSPLYSPESSMPYELHTSFKKLKEDYSNTKFYTEILQECKYFNEYVNK